MTQQNIRGGTGYKAANGQTLALGDLCRTIEGATGRYIGHGLVLYVSAQDNDLGLAAVDPNQRTPWVEAPTPSFHDCHLASMAYKAGLAARTESSST